MNTNTKLTIATIIVIVVLIAIAYMRPLKNTTVPVLTLVNTSSYICMNEKTITAKYYEGETVPVATAGTPPTPNGSATLTLSDGRTLTLPQTLSGSGVRYANKEETIVFWNKGNGVTFTENGQETYMGCIAVKEDTANLPKVYGNGSKGISIRYPDGYTVNDTYRYENMGPSKTISGVKFTIPTTTATGTNLSTDTYVSVEQTPGATMCTTDMFLDSALGGTTTTVLDKGVTYSFASSTDAAAGNRYEETVYVIPGTNPCVAIRYFVHYGAIGNYPKTVKEFDKDALLKVFDAIRQSLTVL